MPDSLKVRITRVREIEGILSSSVFQQNRDRCRTGCPQSRMSHCRRYRACVAALDQPRLARLKCSVATLIDDLHITDAAEAEQSFWNNEQWKEQLQQLPIGCILVIGYAPSVLMAACALIGVAECRYEMPSSRSGARLCPALLPREKGARTLVPSPFGRGLG